MSTAASVREMFGLHGRTVLVTGASSGIGAAAAIECARMGAHVVLTGRDRDRLERTQAALPGRSQHRSQDQAQDRSPDQTKDPSHDQSQCIAADLTVDADVAALVAAAPPLDGVVFAAGIAETVPARQIGAAHLDRVMAVNFRAPVLLTQALIRARRLNAGASLVYVGAIADHVAPAGSSVYSASKAALAAAVRSFALELARQKIRANVIAPGYVDTPMFEQVRQRTRADDLCGLAPLGLIDAADVGRGIVYLLAPASRWVTRSALVVDAGLMVPAR